jgi:hypothetical protein
MNLIFSKERLNIPKYASGSKPYVIDVNKILLKLKKNSEDNLENTSVYLMNMVLREEFEYAKKKKKTSIYYINPSITVDLIKNIKRALGDLEIEVKKCFLVDNDSLKKIHKHVDQIIKIK